MTSKHTPGPWRFEPETKTIRSVPKNYWLASMNSWDGAVDHDANAALIAAAPETAAERDKLRDALQSLRGLPDVMVAAQRAGVRDAMLAALDGTGPSEADKLRETNKELLAALAELAENRNEDYLHADDLEMIKAAIAKARGEV